MAVDKKVGLCWLCETQLVADYYTELEICGHKKMCHRTCAKLYIKRVRSEYPEIKIKEAV